MQVSVRTALAASVAIFVMASVPALAATENFKADLKGSGEVPNPNGEIRRQVTKQ